jgi:hypothetical protein
MDMKKLSISIIILLLMPIMVVGDPYTPQFSLGNVDGYYYEHRLISILLFENYSGSVDSVQIHFTYGDYSIPEASYKKSVPIDVTPGIKINLGNDSKYYVPFGVHGDDVDPYKYLGIDIFDADSDELFDTFYYSYPVPTTDPKVYIDTHSGDNTQIGMLLYQVATEKSYLGYIILFSALLIIGAVIYNTKRNQKEKEKKESIDSSGYKKYNF